MNTILKQYVMWIYNCHRMCFNEYNTCFHWMCLKCMEKDTSFTFLHLLSWCVNYENGMTTKIKNKMKLKQMEVRNNWRRKRERDGFEEKSSFQKWVEKWGNWNSYEWFELNFDCYWLNDCFVFAFFCLEFSYHFPYLFLPFFSFFFLFHYVIWTKTTRHGGLSCHWSKITFIKGGCGRSFCCFEERSREWECDGMLWLWIYDDSRNWMWGGLERRTEIAF